MNKVNILFYVLIFYIFYDKCLRKIKEHQSGELTFPDTATPIARAVKEINNNKVEFKSPNTHTKKSVYVDGKIKIGKTTQTILNDGTVNRIYGNTIMEKGLYTGKKFNLGDGFVLRPIESSELDKPTGFPVSDWVCIVAGWQIGHSNQDTEGYKAYCDEHSDGTWHVYCTTWKNSESLHSKVINVLAIPRSFFSRVDK